MRLGPVLPLRGTGLRLLWLSAAPVRLGRGALVPGLRRRAVGGLLLVRIRIGVREPGPREELGLSAQCSAAEEAGHRAGGKDRARRGVPAGPEVRARAAAPAPAPRPVTLPLMRDRRAGPPSLPDAVQSRDCDAVAQALDRGESLTARDVLGMCPLHMAAMDQSVGVMQPTIADRWCKACCRGSGGMWAGPWGPPLCARLCVSTVSLADFVYKRGGGRCFGSETHPPKQNLDPNFG